MPETKGKMLHRHKMEEKKLQKELKDMKKKSKLSKAELKAEMERLEKEMKEKHEKELAQFSEGKEEDDEQTTAEEEAKLQAKMEEEERAARKIAKAKAKKEKKAEAKRAELEALEEAKANLVDHRAIEMKALKKKLKKQGLSVHKVPADGDCMYNSVAHQLSLVGKEGFTAAKLRDLVANHIRKHKDEFQPFLEYHADDNAESDPDGAFDRYCARLASTAEWGGQPELRALSEVLQRPIEVYRAAEKQPMVMAAGGDDADALRVSYHLKYYALGEHYNSVVPMGQGDEDGEEAEEP